MPKGIFITATGTDVGKTYITAAIIGVLQKAGIDAGYYKAVLSGTQMENGQSTIDDATYVYQKVGLKGNAQEAVTNLLKYPASPHLSAKLEGKAITLEPIIKDYQKMLKRHEFLVVEGSGGLVCPLNLEEPKLMLTDVIKALGLDIVVVANAGLGTINDTVLTLAYAKSLDIETRGIILNHYDDKVLIHRDNQAVLKEMTGLSVTTCQTDGTLDSEDLEKIMGTLLTKSTWQMAKPSL